MSSQPSSIEFIPAAEEDLAEIKERNPEDAERIFDKIQQWGEWVQFGRNPREHLTYLSGSGDSYNFYRQWVGNSGYRVIYEISGDDMLVVAIRPKDDDTYDISEFEGRVDRF